MAGSLCTRYLRVHRSDIYVRKREIPCKSDRRSKRKCYFRKQQYRISEDKDKSIRIARNFIFGKVYNARWILERAARDYPMRLNADKLKEKSAFLYNSLQEIRVCENASKLLDWKVRRHQSIFLYLISLSCNRKRISPSGNAAGGRLLIM